jgi:hypothetical protein
MKQVTTLLRFVLLRGSQTGTRIGVPSLNMRVSQNYGESATITSILALLVLAEGEGAAKGYRGSEAPMINLP